MHLNRRNFLYKSEILFATGFISSKFIPKANEIPTPRMSKEII